jgi:predicted MFS family arabinose efflux permease
MQLPRLWFGRSRRFPVSPSMFIWLVVVLCFLTFGSFIGVRVLMSLFALHLGASQAAVGVLIAFFAVFPLFMSVYAGRVIDRVGTFWPVLGGMAGFGLGVLIPWIFPVLPALYISALVSGLSLVFFGVATQQLVSSIGGASARNRNVSYYSIGLAASGFAGPLGVGYMIDHQGHRMAYLALGIVMLLVTATWFAYRRHVPPARAKDASGAARSIVQILRNRNLRLTIIVSGIVVAGVDLYTFYMPIYGHEIKLSATMIGAVMGAQAIAALLMRLIMPWLLRRWSEENVMAGALLVAGLAYFLFPFFQGVTVLFMISFLLGLGLGCGQPLSLLMVYSRAPAGRSGEVLGVRFTVVNLMHLVIPITFGTLSALIGLMPVFVATAALMGVGSHLSRRAGRGVK